MLKNSSISNNSVKHKHAVQMQARFNWQKHFYLKLFMVWFGGFYDISTFVGYLMPNSFLCKLSVLFQTIQFSTSTQFNCQKNLFQTIQEVMCNDSVKCKYNFNAEKQFYFK